MNMHINKILSSIIFFIPFIGFTQVIFEPNFDIGVEDEGKSYKIPWLGGLNSNLYNKADLDNDGTEELILYDRSANIYQIFKIETKELIPANDLEILLPEIPAGWVLFVDYNYDGKKDIFSNGNRGIVVFENISETGQLATWKKIADPLRTTGFSGKINMIANGADVPAITDIDADGDMDILVYNFAIGGYIRYNKNLSQELYGNADSLEYEIYTRTWGEFEECDCDLFAFSGQTCEELSNGRVMHPGGKALLAIDMDGDDDKDLLAGHEQCEELYFYENMGDKDSAYMIDFSNMFPDDVNPANFFIFPCGFFEDLDFDGVKDLVVAPGFAENYMFKIDFAHSNWFYKNIGSDSRPDFSYQKSNLLQDQSMDFGENSMPAIADLNGDGDYDFLLAANGYWTGEIFSGYVIEFENRGSSEIPSFEIKSKNYVDLSSLHLIDPKINLVDFDGDSAVDLVYTGMAIQDFKPKSWLLINQADREQPVSFSLNNKQEIQLPKTMTNGDSPTFFDVDEDGNVDLLVGKKDGALEYYQNEGNESFKLIDPEFLGIGRDFTLERTNLVSSVGDIDLNGEADLMTTDYSGEGKIYFDFQGLIETEPVNLSYKNSVSQENVSLKFDLHSWIASADFFNQGSQSMLVGGTRGGVQFFQNISIGSPDGDGTPFEVRIYPNPIIYATGLNIKSNQDVNIELISLLGQRIIEPFEVRKFTESILDIGFLANGTYILKSNNDAGVVSSQIFYIFR